ncbi:MAG: class I SAM-dependent methyltransferase [Nitrospira sp.]
MWPPEEADGIGRFRAFVQCASMDADIGARMLSASRSGILGTISNYFIRRGPKDRLDMLIWLFLLNEPVQTTTLACLFSPNDLSALAAMKLIRLDGDVAVCDLAFFECAGLFFATDARVRPPSGVNSVMPLLPDSFDFVGSVSRKPVESTLDLCTGSGVHALVASRHSKHVVATDISPRALQFAEFNAWFNGITNIEFRRGDLFHAVEGRTFDLILSNPPYMPDTTTSPGDNRFCGGRMGDVLWSKILQGLGKHLRSEGLCQMIHMILQFGNERPEDKTRALLGPLADLCNIVICSNTIAYRNEETQSATSIHYGVTTIKRCVNPREVFSSCGPFYPPLSFDVSDLLLALEQASLPEERTLVCKHYFMQSKGNRVFSGGGALMRIVNFLVYCHLVVRRTLRVRSRIHSALRIFR